ncbi:MAG: hypothetical protein CL916_15345 [Deltaproteobacteria bacterium]|nr:hypothetical protein [Deltaproteobacteria bacterium]
MMKALLLALMLTACSSDESFMGMQDMAPEPAEENIFPSLRLDVYPVSEAENLLPQSFAIDPEIDDVTALRFDLADTVELSGFIHGTTIYPHSDGVSVPSTRTVIEAQVRLSRPNSIHGNIMNTDEEGWFSMFVPANDQYLFSITPIQPTDLPFQINETFFLRESQDLEVELDMGLPVFGSISGLEGLHNQASVQLIDRETGIVGPKNPISSSGSFMLRAPNDRDSLIVRLEGTPNSAIPTVEIPFYLDSQDGVELNLDLGSITPVTVEGNLQTSLGIPFAERATILFTSKELISTTGELSVETSNDGNGFFSTKLLPGSWIVDFIPPYDDASNAAPITIEFEIEENTTSYVLPDVLLADDVRVFTRILDSMGQPAPNVLVSFQETHFNKDVYTGFTDSDGRLDIRVPSDDLTVTLTPTNNVEGITQISVSQLTEGDELEWTLEKGSTISGSIYHRNMPISHALIELWENDTLLTSQFLNEAGAFEIKLQVD